MGLSHHSAIIKDMTLFVCGHNQYGQLGLGFSTPTSPFIGANVFTPLDGEWKMVACGERHTLAIKEDGTLWAWGYNYYGQLGLGHTANRNVPTQVGTDRWKMVACGGLHTLAIKEDGTLWAWGWNNYGQLGLGDTTDRNVPTRVSTDRWKMVSCGYYYTLAIKEDGTLWAWGYNSDGQLGLGDTTNRTIPTQVGTDRWKMVACGYNYTLAIKEDGTLWAWGYNNSGRLGLGDTNNRTTPTQVGKDRWKMVACGGLHTLAIKEDGTLWAWGYNGYGRLGLGDTTHRTTPTQVGTDRWKMVSCGYHHTLAIKEDGTLWAWGRNNYGQLGLGNTTDRTIPIQIIDFEKVDLLMNYYFMYVYYLIKSLDKFQTLLNDIWIEDIQITDPPTQEQFEQYGMRYLSVLSNDVSKVQFIKTKNILGDGMEYRWTVDRSQYGGIKTFEIKESEQMEIRCLVKLNDRILTLFNNVWIDTGLTEPLTQQDYLDYGISDISLITEEQWNQLNTNNFEILCWTDSSSDMNLIGNVNPFKPLDEIQKNDFEVLAYSESDNDIKLELTVPEYKPIDLLDDTFEILTYTDADSAQLNLVIPTKLIYYLVSFDSGQTWYTYYKNEWKRVTLTQIAIYGMDKETLESIDYATWSQVYKEGTIDFAIYLKTYDEHVTPVLTQINVDLPMFLAKGNYIITTGNNQFKTLDFSKINSVQIVQNINIDQEGRIIDLLMTSAGWKGDEVVFNENGITIPEV